MGVPIETWRSRVGGFTPRIKKTSQPSRESLFSQCGSRHDKVQLCTFAVLLYVQLLLGIMMLSGDIEMNPGPGPDQSKSHPCLICGKTFLTDIDMRDHMDNTHVSHTSREPPTYCTCCNKPFATSGDCLNHERSMRAPTHECRQPACGALFRETKTRNRHEREVHEQKQKLYECDSCPAMFKRLEQLRIHKNSVHDSCPTMCDVCFQSFTTLSNMKRHKREKHGSGYTCNVCGQFFKGQRGLKDHQTYEHGPQMQTVVCDTCGVKCTNPTSLQIHKRCKHGFQQGGSAEPNLVKSAFKGFLKNFRYTPTVSETNINHETVTDACSPAKKPRVDEHIDRSETDTEIPTIHNEEMQTNDETKADAYSFLSAKKKDMTEDIKTQLREGAVKFILTLQCTLHKFSVDDSFVESSPTFQSDPRQILNDSEIDSELNEAIGDVLQRLAEYQRNGSGWIFDSVVQIDLHVGKYKPLNAAKFMKLPDQLKHKKALTNIKNSDEYCFLYCILAYLYPAKDNPNRVSNYTKYIDFDKLGPKVNGLNLENIQFPMRIRDINKFEQNNPTISINVYSYESKKNNIEVFPLRIAKHQGQQVINLLYQSAEESKSHYVLIRSLDRLLNTSANRRYRCPHCLHGFVRDDLLQSHIPYCQVHSAQRIEMPVKGNNVLKFKDGDKQLPVPYILVADFECSIIKGDDSKDMHKPNSFCLYKIEHTGKEIFDPIVYVGSDASDVFAKRVDEESEWILAKQADNMFLNRKNMTAKEIEDFDKAESCHICGKSLNDDKVRDHCHVTGEYRGAAHSDCNLRYQLPRKIPLFLHNFSKYDLKVIVEGIRHTAKRISVIPENMENYISMDVNKVRYLDSFRFLDASLENLVDKMNTDDFYHTREWLRKQGYEEHMDLLLRKNSYPYEWVDSIDKLDTPNFPHQSCFYNKIKGETISDEEYAHALNVYRTLGMETFRTYHTLYLALDVLLLSDVMQSFRKRCLSLTDDGLDPAHYFTMPNFSFDAMLKSTNVELELLTDPTMYLAFENSIRGGISVVSHRQAEANNPYMTDYDETKPTSYLMYVDAVNLYGKAMLSSLPISDFRWMNDEEIKSLDIPNIPDDGDDCYLLEVDLTYPDHLHKTHSDYPLLAGPMLPTDNLLSPYSAALKEKLALKNSSTKLIPSLLPKSKYLVHYQNLKFYLKHGIILDKVHRVIHCKQKPWLKDFVLGNTEKRKQSNNSLDKDFYKKKTNSVYGKCEQGVRKYQRVELVNNIKRVQKLISDPSYLSHKIFFGDQDGDDGSLAAIHRRTTTLKLNKPIYAGFAILELSKLVMFKFYYDHLKPKYGDNMKLCMTDTDSFIFHVKTQDIYRDMQKDQHLYDTSDYPTDHFLHSLKNKKVPGTFSDELHGTNILTGFVGCRSKMYALKLDGGEEKRKAKGIPRRIVSRDMRYNDYVECLNTGNLTSVTYSSIKSQNMRLYTTTTRKIGLSSYDDKRYILNDGKSTLAYGHCDIKNNLATQ